MATVQEHLKKAEHNEKFFVCLLSDKSDPFLDWVITGMFYSALHYIRALAAQHGFKNVSSYAQIDRLFSTLTMFKHNKKVYISYRRLKDFSRNARYEMEDFTRKEVEELEKEDFQNIKTFVLSYFQASSTTQPGS
ncbi:MAG: HEPN domain-containing protein [Candidatus Desulfofervidaceae bacterium]|nr:HEPN domain-containing protein [Candidatus Desulfofervidaceae bacterium]